MNRSRFARANHVLVPDTSAARDRYRNTSLGRAMTRIGAVFRRFSAEGLQYVALAMASALFALDVRRTQIYVAWGALAGLLAASWIASFFYGLRGVHARAIVPRRIARGVVTPLAVEIVNDTDRELASLRVRGPFLPWDGEWMARAPGLPRLERRGRARLTSEARFERRGEHHLDPFYVQALVPLGLALGAPLLTEAPRFLVVPRIAAVTSLSLPRTRRHHAGGVPRALHTADSRELAGVRPYRPGDAMRDLHVRTWARTGTPFVREYQEEYFTHVAVVVDAARQGASETRPGDIDAPLEGALSLAAGLSAQLLSGEALVDLVVLGDGDAEREGEATSLGRGRGTLEVALDRLATAERARSLDPERAKETILAMRDRLSSLVLVLSAWDEARAALVSELAAEGIEALVILASEAANAPPPVRVVAPSKILAGEGIAL